jgi:hypothetical protein
MHFASRLSSQFPYSTAIFPRSFRIVSDGRLTASTSGYERIDSAWPARGIPRDIKIPFDI